PGRDQPGQDEPGRDRAGPVRPVAPEGTLVLSLVVGLLVVAVMAIGVTKLVDDVTEGGGVAVLDHPVARFVVPRRVRPLTTVLDVVTNAGGPVGMAVLALIAGVLLGVAWRSWTPPLVLGVTYAGIGGITLVVKSVVGRPRPPVAHAVQSAPGFSFPSAHAAVAIAVCGAVAWLCGLRLRSWAGRAALWSAAAMIAALVGLSRIYLGVHWTSDVLGGWALGALWLAVVISAWTVFTRSRRTRAPADPEVP
ncbi:MAG TPA: phosphatase PAP2 family protein, partial [Streptosporangiaceae bacterium]